MVQAARELLCVARSGLFLATSCLTGKPSDAQQLSENVNQALDFNKISDVICEYLPYSYLSSFFYVHQVLLKRNDNVS